MNLLLLAIAAYERVKGSVPFRMCHISGTGQGMLEVLFSQGRLKQQLGSQTFPGQEKAGAVCRPDRTL